MTIDKFSGNFQYPQNVYNNNSGQQGVRRNGGVENTPTISASEKVVDYDSKIKEVYKKDGIQGLLDYLNTLDKRLVSDLSSVNEGGTWTLSFTINGKRYTFVEKKSSHDSKYFENLIKKIAKAANSKEAGKQIKNVDIDELIEYLNSLDKSVLTYMNTTKKQTYDYKGNLVSETTYLVFTLKGESYMLSGTKVNSPSKKNQEPYISVDTGRAWNNYGGELDYMLNDVFEKDGTEGVAKYLNTVVNLSSNKNNENTIPNISYDSILNKIFEKDGIDGVMKLLDSLDSAKYFITTELPTKNKETTVYRFHIGDKTYSFEVENSTLDATQTKDAQQKILDDIFNEGGITGLLEYITTLDEGAVTSLDIAPDSGRFKGARDDTRDIPDTDGAWTVTVTIDGKTYKYVETCENWDSDPWAAMISDSEVAEKHTNYEKEVVNKLIDVNEYDLKDCKGNIYILGGADEEANIEQLKKDLEKSRIKEQLKEKLMQTTEYNYDWIDADIPEIPSKAIELEIGLMYDKILDSVLNDLTPTYTTNENGEKVPCVKFEDVVQRLIATIYANEHNTDLKSIQTEIPSTGYYTNKNNYAAPVTYENKLYEVNNKEDFEYKRDKMKKSLMEFMKPYAEKYGINSLNTAAFEALFEECVDAALDKMSDIVSEGRRLQGFSLSTFATGYDYISGNPSEVVYESRYIQTSQLVSLLNEELSARKDTLEELK